MSAEPESVSAKRRKLDGSVTDRCQYDVRVAARTIHGHCVPLPDFKLIFKIQSFCVCSFDSSTKHALYLFLVREVIEMHTHTAESDFIKISVGDFGILESIDGLQLSKRKKAMRSEVKLEFFFRAFFPVRPLILSALSSGIFFLVK